jgi:hypothetical protein
LADSDMSEVAQLPSAIGEYVMAFSSLEMMMVLVTGLLIDGRPGGSTMFLSKRLTAETKRDNLQRAMKLKLTSDRLAQLKPTLTSIQKCIERRNDIMHGSFITHMRDGVQGMSLGRFESMIGFHDGAESISTTSIRADIEPVGNAIAALINLLAERGPTTIAGH